MMNIKNFALGSALACAFAAAAGTVPNPVITGIDMARSENNPNQLYISYTIAGESFKIPSNTEVKVTPVLQYAGGELELPSVIYAGRNAFLAHKRNHTTPEGALLMRAKGDDAQFSEVIPWNDAYTNSTLTFRSETIGCRCKGEGESTQLPAQLAMNFAPPAPFELIYPVNEMAAMENAPEQVVKTRSLSRSAYVNYKINSPILLPDYKSNPLELAAIVATIDSVRADKDLTVNAVRIHGYASPDGPYTLNEKLAAGRTESLRKYVDNHYGFGSLLTAESTPEDWSGLREWVAASALADKAGILEVIDSNLKPDEKEQKIKKLYPASFQMMLSQVYPSLRRADYKIEYTVKTFTEPTTISDILNQDPSKLSYEELMILVRNYGQDSPRGTALLIQSAELFPDDPRAQLSAAMALIRQGNDEKAAALLANAGDSEVADYARGVIALHQGNDTEARRLLTRAARAGITGAQPALQTINQ